MVKINASFFQQCCDCRKIGLLLINKILAGVVLEGSARDDKGGIWKDFMLSVGL